MEAEKINAGSGMSAQVMDEERHKNVSYQYLCHLEEAKNWMEACINEELPEAGDLEEHLRNGVYLAKLAHFFSPETVPLRRIYDPHLTKYREVGLTFRHTDNINHFLKALEKIGLPSIFYPETTDVYDRKNMPRVVFCLHALSLFLFRLGIAPQIENLYGKATFSDEVMEAMMKELGKYGCQLPQFSKIGGILANELPVEEAALHAAIIAVNKAIDDEDDCEVMDTLRNPTCHLKNVLNDNKDSYLQWLSDAKRHKMEMAINKSRDEGYIPDAYDELLTQAEVQGHISYVNVFCAMEKVEDAVRNENSKALLDAISHPHLALKGINRDFAGEYMCSLAEKLGEEDGKNQSINRSLNISLIPTTLSKAAVQTIIISVNETAEYKRKLETGLAAVNKSLLEGSSKATFTALQSIQDYLPPLIEFAATLYHEEMSAIRADAQVDLNLEEIQGGVKLLSAVGLINAALDTHNPTQVWHTLSDPQAHLQALEKNNTREYFSAMSCAQQAKVSCGNSCPLLTYLELQEIVEDVNSRIQGECDQVRALTDVNMGLYEGDVEKTLKALQHPALQLRTSLSYGDALHCFHMLKERQSAKSSRSGDDTSELWLEDIVEVLKTIEKNAAESTRTAALLTNINVALTSNDDATLFELFRSPKLVHLHIKKADISAVRNVLKKKNADEAAAVVADVPWIPYSLTDGSKVFLNLKQGIYQWEKPDEVVTAHKSRYVTLVDLEDAVSSIRQQEALTARVEHLMVQLQAFGRGKIVRQKQLAKQRAALTIQAWWRMVQARRTYVLYCQALRMWLPHIIILQRAVRAWLQRRHLAKLTSYFSQHEREVLLIQKAWRAYKARQDLHSLTHQNNPPFSVIKRFVHLLDVSTRDLEEELKMQRVKSDIVKTIRHTHQLESQIEELDVKIGLLVHNRITLQDVIPADKENVNPNAGDHKTRKSKKGSKDTIKSGSLRSQRGLKALKKESREKLLGYQHLFYLLQTQPHYLATLIFALPPGKTTKFIENVIFSLYNYGANDRDSYLLLKLFKTVLEEEIRCKVLRLSDIVSGNPLVVKMIVAFNREGTGQASLRDLLGPLIQKILGDSSMQINTNPVDIYKNWVNQLEMTSGQASGLPYTVDQEQALQYPEVQKRLAQAITTLKEVSLSVCQQITENRDMIPYALLYMARVMRAALQRRFPHVPEKEILKVVGNLIYYRYINSAIVAPDAFGIITVTPDQKLNNSQRHNLASIAKILQFAASKKGFGDEASHLKCLNPFIVECHEKFKAFFRHCCEVPEPEEEFNVTQYSEATLIVKPTIYITIQEICETHQLLLDHEEIIAPESNDRLHTLLSDLGERPSVHSLVGEALDYGMGTMGRMEVCLALTNKFDLMETTEEKDKKDPNRLFNRTKQLLVDVVRCVDGTSINELVTGPTLSPQEEKYRSIVHTRSQQENQAKQNDAALNRSNSFLRETRVSLHEVKTRLSHNLRRLENHEQTNRSDGYQSLLNAIASDIVNQRQYRISRKQELQRLLGTAKQLDEKKKFYTEQLESYRTYLQTCLSNIAARNKNVHLASSKTGGEKARSKQTIKYTGTRLMEKGVLLELEDLPKDQSKNVLFEITPLATTGIFHVNVKFMGVSIEQVEIDIQDLLQLQYEGVTVKKMFSKVKVNVNLLLHLLNAKFYSKTKK